MIVVYTTLISDLAAEHVRDLREEAEEDRLGALARGYARARKLRARRRAA